MRPGEYELETRYGPVILRPTSANHIYVEGGRRGDFVVNRVPTYFTLHLRDYGEGFFEPLREQYALFTSRPGDPTGDVSRSVKKKIEAAVPQDVNLWVDKHPEALEEADEEARQEEIERLQEELAKLEAQADEIRNRLDQLGA